METKKTTMKVKGKNGWEIIHPETEVEQVVGLDTKLQEKYWKISDDGSGIVPKDLLDLKPEDVDTDADTIRNIIGPNYLSLNGGGMTGPDIYRAVTNSSMVLASCNSSYASKLQLYGYESNDSRRGGFTLRANATLYPGTVKDLEGLPDGTLTWNGSGHKVEIKSMAFPSSTKVSCGITASGQTYTTPANGYVVLAGRMSTVQQYIGLSSNGFGSQVWGNSNTATIFTYIPVLKGRSVTVSYNCTFVGCDFFYAEGEI